MTAAELIEQVRGQYDGELTEARATSKVDAWVGVPPQDVQGMARFIVEAWDPVHLSTITGVDNGREIEVLYHFVAEGCALNLRAAVPKGVDRIDSITAIVPAAVLYEREVMELLGIRMAGHPDPRRLVLPDDWPEGDYPLRRDDVEEEAEEGNG
ncbi:MAG: NADH-quinone oxidoreductase subunit C [Armatimonadota bacterium]